MSKSQTLQLIIIIIYILQPVSASESSNKYYILVN